MTKTTGSIRRLAVRRQFAVELARRHLASGASCCSDAGRRHSADGDVVLVVKVDADAQGRRGDAADAVLAERDGHDAVDIRQKDGHSYANGHSGDGRRHQNLKEDEEKNGLKMGR